MTESRERFIAMRQELYRHAAPKPATARWLELSEKFKEAK